MRLGGPVVARGYRLRPDLTAAAFDGDVFTTSDLGRLDGGVLTVLGRADDVVVSGGENVAPLAVEAALGHHPSVVEAAVIGVPDDEWGSRVVALVVLRAPLTLAEARDHVAASLPRPGRRASCARSRRCRCWRPASSTAPPYACG